MADDLKRVGLVFKADGAVDFKNSMKEVNASIQENRSAFKLAKTAWDDGTKSADKLKSTQKYLADQTKDYSDKVSMLQGELKELEGAENRDEAAIAKKKNQLNTAEASLNSYKKGLEEVTNQLKSGSAQLEEYAEKLKKTGANIESAGKTMTKGLTVPILAAGAAGVKSAMDLDEGYDTIIAKTGATGDKLQEMNDIADEVFGSMPVEMTDVGAAVGEINTRFGSTGEELKGLTEKFLKFADVNSTDVNSAVQLVSRAMGDAGIPTSETAAVLDKLTAAGQASGIEMSKLTENMAKYGAPMRALGLTTDESIAIFAGWEKAGVNTEIAFSGMKKAIGTWGKEGKNSTEEFKKTLKAIQDTPDIASATSMAIETFGQKAGPDLADAIKGGRFEYEDFLNIVQQSGGTLDTTFESMQDPWDKAKIAINNLKLAGAELGQTLMDTLGPMIDAVCEKIKQFSNWFKGLGDEQKRTIITIAGLVAAIGPMLIVVGKIVSGAGTLLGGIAKVSEAVTKLGPMIKGVLGGIGTAAKALFGIIAANPVIAIITAVIAIVVLLYTKCEWFRDAVKVVWDAIKLAFQAVVDWFAGIPEWWSNLWTGVKDKATQLWNEIKTVVSDITNSIKDIISNIFNGIKTFFVTIWEGIKEVVSNAVNAVKNTVTSVFSGISDAVSSIFNGIKTVASSVWNGIKTAISGVVNGIKDTVSNVFNSIKDIASNVWEKIKNGIMTPINAAKDAVKTAIDKIKGFFDFSWSLPKLKMPHFSISGKFSLNPPSIPKFNVSWYAKGGILNSPTIFGMGSNGSLLGGGEAGKEAIIPIAKLKEYIREENQQNNSNIVAMLKEAFKEITLVAQNEIYIGDRKFLDVMTEMVMKKIGSKQKNGLTFKGAV